MGPKNLPRGGPREFDWYCQCGVLNYSRRFDCVHCASLKAGFGSTAWDEYFSVSKSDLLRQREALDKQIAEVDRGVALLSSVRASEQSQSSTYVPPWKKDEKSSKKPSSRRSKSVSESSSDESEKEDLMALVKELRADIAVLKKSKTKEKSSSAVLSTREERQSFVKLSSAEQVRLGYVKSKTRSCSEEERRCRRKERSRSRKSSRRVREF